MCVHDRPHNVRISLIRDTHDQGLLLSSSLSSTTSSQSRDLQLTCTPVWCCNRATEWPVHSSWGQRLPQHLRPNSQVGRLGGCVCLRMDLWYENRTQLQLLLLPGWSDTVLMCEKSVWVNWFKIVLNSSQLSWSYIE